MQPLLSLHEAAEKGDIAGILENLRAGEDVNSKANREYFGVTPLVVAAQEGQKPATELLIAHGADVNLGAGQYDLTPLHWAAEQGHCEIAAILLANGARIDARAAHHAGTPLHRAAYRGHTKMIALLLDNGANIEARMKHGQTALGQAVCEGGKDAVELLVRRGANLRAEMPLGSYRTWETLLRYSVWLGRLDVAQVLMAHGVEVDFFSAAGLGLENVVKPMLDSNPALANARLANGSTPLHWSAKNGRKAIVELLLEHGADIHAKREQDRTRVQDVPKDCPDLADYLLEHGAVMPDSQPGPWDFLEGMEAEWLIDEGRDVNEQDEYGDAALHYCASDAYEDREREHALKVMRLLIEAGADVDIVNKDGETPLHTAAHHGSLAAASLLLEHGASVDAQDYAGRTPLHKAVLACRKVVAELLLQHKATVTVKDRKGFSPLDIPIDRFNRKIIKMMRAGGKA